MDISGTIQAKSDQLNSDDLIGGPVLYTVEKVTAGPDEQPVNVHLVENPGHPYRPSKSMRRVLVAIWGKEASAWNGHQFVLYRDPQVKFGGEVVGGIKISHASHIDGPQSIPLTVKRGQKARHTVDPLQTSPNPFANYDPTPDDLAAQIVAALADSTTEAEVREWGNRAHARDLLDVQVKAETVRNHVTNRLAELAQEPDATSADSPDVTPEAEGGDA